MHCVAAIIVLLLMVVTLVAVVLTGQSWEKTRV
jgi:hypothetical protein